MDQYQATREAQTAHEPAQKDRMYIPATEFAFPVQATTGCDLNTKMGVARERTAREFLYSRIDDLQHELAELTELAKALPQELPYRADRALRRLIQK